MKMFRCERVSSFIALQMKTKNIENSWNEHWFYQKKRKKLLLLVSLFDRFNCLASQYGRSISCNTAAIYGHDISCILLIYDRNEKNEKPIQ